MPETNNRTVKPALRKKRVLPEAAKAHQFKPGQSGNPGGRPRKPRTLFSDAMRDVLAEITADRSKAELLADKLFQEALVGANPVAAIKEIADRTEGKAAQNMNLNANISSDTGDRVEEIISIAVARAAKSSTAPND